MPKLYCAWRTDDAYTSENRGEPILVHACNSFSMLKQQMKGEVDNDGKKVKKPEVPLGSEWTVVHFMIKPDVPTLCKILREGITSLDYEWSKDFRINQQGQLREVIAKD